MVLPTIFTIKGHFLNDSELTDGVYRYRLTKSYTINPSYVFFFLLKREVSGYSLITLKSTQNI